ncbi:MAG: hypothetical protein E7613_04415 [Ruminococcaceae bacterium]|nr:hypothetical protein [Oscillospiraceae bacterium]
MNPKLKKILSICRFIGLLLSMYLCVLFGISGYSLGYTTGLGIFLTAIGLVIVAYYFTHKMWELLFLYANLLVSVFIGSNCVTQLYYTNISSDQATLLVGEFLLYIALAVTFISMCICIILKAFALRKQKRQKISS